MAIISSKVLCSSVYPYIYYKLSSCNYNWIMETHIASSTVQRLNCTSLKFMISPKSQPNDLSLRDKSQGRAVIMVPGSIINQIDCNFSLRTICFKGRRLLMMSFTCKNDLMFSSTKNLFIALQNYE